MPELTAERLRDALARESRAVLVLVEEAAGSTPRETGTAMLVSASASLGTIGGGAVEHAALAEARSMLANDAGDPQRRSYPLGPDLDQCCGGRLTLAFAPLDAADPSRLGHDSGAIPLWEGGPVWRPPRAPRPVLVYGGGHVGSALVSALAPLPFAVRWIEARKDGFLAPAPLGVSTALTPLPEAEAAAAPDDAFHVVVTHSHALDLEIVAAVLAAGRFGYCGLIGSATKRALFERRLAERGIGADSIARLVCPIGLPAIRDKRPAVIAASVAADLLARDGALVSSGLQRV